MAEIASRGVVLRRRLPARFGGWTLYVWPQCGLRHWRFDVGKAGPALLEMAERYVRPGDVVWDAGANVGLFTFAAAYRAARVLAFEPDPWLADMLERTAASFSMAAIRSLITGGAGFIGCHLAEELLREGQEVYVLDNLSTGSIDNIEHLKGRKGFHYVIDSLEHEHLLAEMIDRSDVVYHLAAAVGVKLIVESPVNTIETNVHGTELVLKHANKKRKKVIVASTSEVYGKSTRVPFREDHDLVLGPTSKGRWSYACSKAIDEFLTIAYWHEKKLPVVVVRLFNTVGPRQTGRYGMVIPSFVKQAVEGSPITVYGSGNQSRCFTYVGDVVKALVALSDHPGAVGDVFNIGGGREITINELAILVKEKAGSESEIVHVPYDQAYEKGFEDMPRRVPDITKISHLLGWRPTINIDEIVEKVIEFQRAGTWLAESAAHAQA